MRYALVLGLNILHCLTALNVTDDNGLLDETVSPLTQPMSWYEGLKVCRQKHSFSDKSYEGLGNKTYIAELVALYGPLWTYGLEAVTRENGKTAVFRISRRHKDQRAQCICATVDDPVWELTSNVTREEGISFCDRRNFSFPFVTPRNISRYKIETLVNSPFWIGRIDEDLFLKNEDIRVRCFIYDGNGDIKTEDCKSNHRTICGAVHSENYSNVVEYVNKNTLPALPKSTLPGTSSAISNSHSSMNSNETKFSSSPSSISSTPSYANKSELFMDPQIIYTVIGVISAIVVAIVVAICVCCCRRKKQKAAPKRQSTKLADNYSETVDSMPMKEPSVYETPNNSEYATPDDAILKARQRQSIGENEYDVINADPKKQKQTGVAANAYNHVTLVSPKDKQNCKDLGENEYDVTNFGRQRVLISQSEDTGHEYGHVDIKS